VDRETLAGMIRRDREQCDALVVAT